MFAKRLPLDPPHEPLPPHGADDVNCAHTSMN